ncbi:DUF3857 domain-containing protein [Hanstruepera ponticola]|uniref:DUF3857 domain-containing protein n=1 Tax=Hanstruepera ponticola TaxID=2042995 RepID=UPI000CF055D6|nr:DUF3857 domain-containing protein [Hanstruepera ponticola]
MKLRLSLLLTLFFSTIIIAQSKDEQEARDFFWGENDTYKTVVNVPEKWQNESAVIIYKNENYDFHKFGKKVNYKSSIRKRIKLLDKAAVEEFSEFSYQKRFRVSKGVSLGTRGNNIIGVKVIKPDGSESIIDINKEAVEVDGETKVAIPNLEVGDIIDYYSYSIEPFKSTYAFGFNPVERTLSEEYPIMDYKLFFETENDFFINFKSFNGAPELKKIETDKKNLRRYELTESDIEKHKNERWFFPLVELPCYKFQVFFARSGKFEKRADAFLSDKEEIIKTSVSKEEVLNQYDDIYPYGDLKYEERFLKNKEFASDSEKAIAIYYFMRHHYLTRFIEAYIIKDAGILDYPFGVYGNDATMFNSDNTFLKHYIAILKDNKIKCDLLVGKKRYDGSLDDLLIYKNLNTLIKTQTSPPVYVKPFGPHTTVNTFDPMLEGAEAYLLSPVKRWDYDQIERTAVPVSNYQVNKTNKNIAISLTDDFNGFSVKSVVSYTGHEKEDQQFDRLIFKDYVDEDYQKYETESFIELLKKSKQEKYRNELNAVIEKLREKQKETFVNSAKTEYNLTNIEDYTYSINETGRYTFEDPLSYTEAFISTGDLIKKAGPNYIIEIGKFIGGQIDILDENKERDENIYMGYPRSYQYSINLTVPEGYTIAGLDKLNKSIDNKTGSFVSSASLDGNTLTIKTSKEYKHNYVSKSDWQLMINFLDEAHQFTNEKILLKKS